MSKSSAFLAALLGVALSAPAAAVSLSTGTAPWQVNSNPAVVETSIPGLWITPFGDGFWIGSAATDSLTGLVGTSSFTLSIGAIAGSSGNFTLQYAADNDVTWSISSGTLGGATSCLNDTCFYGGIGAPYTLTGSFSTTSVLTATVLNIGNLPNPAGLLVVGSVVPEPSSALLLTLGVTGMLLRLRRSRTDSNRT
jgi:hypothetical protein